MGELRRRGRIWWIRYYRNGRRHEESARTEKKTEAERLLKLREGDVARGVPISPKVGRLRFEDAAEDLTREYRVNGRRSLVTLTIRLTRNLTPFFTGRRMAAITTADMRAYTAARLQAGAAAATVNRELAVVKRMYVLAIQAGTLLARPYIPMLQEHNVRQGFFEREQFEGRAPSPPAIAPRARDVRLLHGMAHPERSADPAVVAGRPAGGGGAARAGHDEEQPGAPHQVP